MKAVGGSIFSAPVLVLMVVLLGVGIIFGWMVANTMSNRQVYNARSDDAARVHEAIEPRLAEVEEAQKLVGELSADEPDYEAIDKLAEMEFKLEGNVLSSNRLLLGPEIIDYVTSFAADASMLQVLIEDHKRITESEKEELDALVADNEVLKKDRFAVLFDYDFLAQRSGGDDYMPKPGKLVTVPEEMEKDDEGQIEVEMLGGDRTVKTRVQGIIPLHKADILKTGGDNALQRYKSRLVRINRQLAKFDEYSDRMMSSLQELAEKEEAPLVNL